MDTACTRASTEATSLLTRTGLNWSHRYERTTQARHALPAKAAYLDGELCALNARRMRRRRRLPVRPHDVPARTRVGAY
jgi:ATP-dependent DNA ligase